MSSSSSVSLRVSNAGMGVLNGLYRSRPSASVPEGFARTCDKMRWDPSKTWEQLAVSGAPWYEHDENGSYVYLHKDGRWWMDDPSGAGVYVCPAGGGAGIVPSSGGWQPLSGGVEPMPTVVVHDDETTDGKPEL